MTYSNASPLMVLGKNRQGLRWFVLNVSAVEVLERLLVHQWAVVEVVH
jgi:hypothetical protein